MSVLLMVSGLALKCFSVLAAYAEGETVIEGYKAINKSYPLFFQDFKKLGGKANVITDR